MSAELVFQLLGGAGFLVGVAALLHFLNTAKGARTKSSAEANTVYRTFVNDAMGDVNRDRARLCRVVGLLVDLAIDLLRELRIRGASSDDLDPYHDRLEAARSLPE